MCFSLVLLLMKLIMLIKSLVNATAMSSTVGTKKIDKEAKKKIEKDSKTVRGHMLTRMSNSLFDLFINQKSARTKWDTLLQCYDTNDGRRKK